jgi:predicted nicotinamide N-methyase
MADTSVRLLRPGEPERLLNDPEVLRLNQAHDYMPYWAYLWPGAFLLAQYVANRRWPRDAWALELGCGLGLAGLTAIGCGLKVHFTDYDIAPLRFVEQSVAGNCVDATRVRLSLLDWNTPPAEVYPILLGADLLYEERLVPLVVGVVDRMLSADGVALFAGPERSPTELFPQCLAESGLMATIHAATATDHQGRPVRGTVHEVRRR